MAFTGRTPESLIPRSDSRNPATTCKGITKSGRPCRRAIDAKDTSRSDGVLVVASVVSDSDDEETGAAAYFCWQHKDQAERLAAGDNAAAGRQDTQLYPLKERSSIDTLVARLGVLEVDEPAPIAQKRRRKSRQDEGQIGNCPPRRINRPFTWDNVQGPLMSVPSDVMAEKKRRAARPGRRPPPPKKPSFWQSLCCGGADDDYVEVVRHKRRTERQETATTQYVSESPMVQQPPRTHQSRASNPLASSAPAPRPQSSNVPARKPLGEKPARPLNRTSRPSETSNLLSYIPKSVTPQTASSLLAELSKPISQHDEEGYIYIFWLTPESLGPAPSSTASTLLAPPTRPEQNRRTSDVLRQYSVRRPQRPNPRPRSARQNAGDATRGNNDEKDTILLKIGRASNVTRRMNEWTRQCGYSLSLVRFYPYVSATPSPSPSPHASPAGSRRPSSQNVQRPGMPQRPSDGVRKVPHAHRVERLIHIELAEKRVPKSCDACGKEHREWFEVEASSQGVKGVDAVIKRWVEWAERANQ